MNAATGSIVTNDTVDAVSDITLDAGTSIDINAATTATLGNISMTAQTGDISLNAQLQAKDLVTLTASEGAILASDLPTPTHHISVDKLIIHAADGIASTGAALRTNVNSIELANTGTGDINIVEHDAITVTKVSAANGSIDIQAGADINVGTITAAAGNVILESMTGSVVKIDADSLITAQDLNVTAQMGINLNSKVDSATLIARSAGIQLDEQDSIDLNSIVSDADVNITAGQDIRIDSIIADGGRVELSSTAGNITELGADVDTDITADDIKLSAKAGSIGAKGNAIELSTNSLEATSGGHITLNDLGGIILNDINATGDVSITVEDDINAASGSTITAGGLELIAGSGIGNSSIINTIIDSLIAETTTGDINISQTGDLNIDSASSGDGNIIISASGDLNLGLLSTGNGSIELSSGGAITDGNGDDLNIDADSIILKADKGIGVNDALELSTSELSAESASGDINLSNSGHDLVLGDINTSGGDVTIAQTDDKDITISKDIILDSGNLDISSGGVINQDANLSTGGDGNITIEAGEGITSTDGVHTSVENGNITYDAPTIKLPNISSDTGWVTIKVDDANDLANAGIINAPFIKVETSDDAQISDVEHMFANNGYNSYAIWLNNRLIGGLLTRDSTFVRESSSITSARHDLGYGSLYGNGRFDSLIINDTAWKNEQFSWSHETQTWNFAEID